jgi:hypothetical protein
MNSHQRMILLYMHLWLWVGVGGSFSRFHMYAQARNVVWGETLPPTPTLPPSHDERRFEPATQGVQSRSRSRRNCLVNRNRNEERKQCRQ